MTSRMAIVIGLVTLAMTGCGGDENGGSSASDIAAPDPSWEAELEDYWDRPVIDVEGLYTPAFVDALEECGAGQQAVEALSDYALAQQNTVALGEQSTFDVGVPGSADSFTFELEHLTSFNYEVLSCERLK